MLYEAKGDIFEVDGLTHIAHQTNCTTTGKAMGIASEIFKRYPEADTYKRNVVRQPGSIHVFNRVVNMNAQVRPGGPGKVPYDTIECRLQYFKRCLKEMEERLPPNSIVGFPAGIGCGMAKGDWPTYLAIIKEWAEKVSFTVVVVTYEQ